MANAKRKFGWCQLILYILSMVAAAAIAAYFIPPKVGYGDVLLALLIFLALFFLFLWLSSYVCGMLGSKSAEDDRHHGLAGHAAAAGAGLGATATAAAAHASTQTASVDDDLVNTGRAADHGSPSAERGAIAPPRTARRSFEDSIAVLKDEDDAGADEGKAAKAPEPKAEPKPTKKTAAKKSSASKSTSKKASAGEAEKKPARKPAKKAAKASAAGAAGAKAGAKNKSSSTAESGGNMPRNLKKAADKGKADNLKEIKGIGPKLEKLCHKLGIYHFSQIAEWQADEIEWMDGNLEGFHGRVSRDDWVGQAKILAAGGETEFSQRVEDGKVY